MHLGDDAERYALGELPLDERPRIEAHLAECELCRRRVAEAEAVTWSLAGTLSAPAHVLPRRSRIQLPRWSSALLAAMFALAFIAQTVRAQRLAASVTSTSAVLDTLASSHFFHAQFDPTGAPITAKVIYARDGAWMYVIVASRERYRIERRDGGRHDEIGNTASLGSTSTAFIVHAGQPHVLELLRGSTVVARAKLAFAP